MTRTAPDTRQDILTVASRLFGESGFKGTSLQEISREVGCSKATLLYHFATKEAILAELMAPAVKELAALDAELAPLKGRTAQRVAAVAFAELAVRHRRELAAMHGDIPELLTLGVEPFDTVLELSRRLHDAMSGRSDIPADRLAATVLLSGIPAACAKATDLTDDELRPALIAISARILNLPELATPSTQ